MKNGQFLSARKLLLTSIDVIVSLFLIFGGGYIATSRSAMIGGTAVVFGFFLIYLSIGLWTDRIWQQVIRLCFYGLSSLVLLFAVVFHLITEEQSLAKQSPVPLIAAGVTAVFAVSIRPLRRAWRVGHSIGITD